VESGAMGAKGSNNGGGWLAVGRRRTGQQQSDLKTLVLTRLNRPD